MEKDIRQSLQEHIFRLENRRRELMRPEYLRLGLTIGQGQPRILMYLLTEDGCSQREIAENCHLDVTTLSRTLLATARKGLSILEVSVAVPTTASICSLVSVPLAADEVKASDTTSAKASSAVSMPVFFLLLIAGFTPYCLYNPRHFLCLSLFYP